MFTIQSSDRKLSMTMSAEMANIDAACNEVSDFIDKYELEFCRFAILLGIREALTNAVIHGSGRNASLTVRMDMERDDNSITVWVVDQGTGFDWMHTGMDVPEPWSCGGRGLPIIHEYFDQIAFNDAGNAISFSMKM